MKKFKKVFLLSFAQCAALPLLVPSTINSSFVDISKNNVLYSDQDSSELEYTPTFNFSKKTNVVNYSVDYGQVETTIYHGNPLKEVTSHHKGVGYYNIPLEWVNFLGINPLEESAFNQYLKKAKNRNKWISFRQIYEADILLANKELMLAGRNPDGGIAKLNIQEINRYNGASYHDEWGHECYAGPFDKTFISASIEMKGIYVRDGQKDFSWTQNGWTLKYSCSENLFDVLQVKYNTKEWPYIQLSTTKQVDFTMSLTNPSGTTYSLFYDDNNIEKDKKLAIDTRSECFSITNQDFEPASQISSISSVEIRHVDFENRKPGSFSISLSDIYMYDYAGNQFDPAIVKGWLTGNGGSGVEIVYLACDGSEPFNWEGNGSPTSENAIVNKNYSLDQSGLSVFDNYSISVNEWKVKDSWSIFDPARGPMDYYYIDNNHRQYFSWYCDYSSDVGKSIQKISSFTVEYYEETPAF